ncbi:MAG TPA: NUDIX hydrolase [Pseudolabrys sp.]|nr:NUDIX hydrolase [Pseudolabrys sp.]
MSGYQIVRMRTAYEGWLKLHVATVRNPEGRTSEREIEHHGSAICVLPYNEARRTAVLVKQFRAPVFHAAKQPETLEAIAGLIEEDDPADCVRREAQEEASLALDTLEPLFSGWTMPGISTEHMHFFLATYSRAPRTESGGEPDEDVTPVELSLSALAAMADSGELVDVKTLLVLQTLRLRRPDLF